MIKKAKKTIEKETKAFVGDKTLKGAGKLAKPFLKGFGYAAAGVASIVLLLKGAQKVKEKKND